jgi:hypothetical protein
LTRQTDTVIDNEKIPEQTYKELIDLFGHEKADNIIIESHYNYYSISIIIFEERTVRYFGLSGFQKWIRKKTRLSLVRLVVILILLGILIYIFWPVIAY